MADFENMMVKYGMAKVEIRIKVSARENQSISEDSKKRMDKINKFIMLDIKICNPLLSKFSPLLNDTYL